MLPVRPVHPRSSKVSIMLQYAYLVMFVDALEVLLGPVFLES